MSDEPEEKRKGEPSPSDAADGGTSKPPTPENATDPGPAGDGFPLEGELTKTVQYMVGVRLAGSLIGPAGIPAHVYGQLIYRLSQLYSSLRAGGTSASRSVDAAPMMFTKSAYGHSIDVLLSPTDDELFDDEIGTGEASSKSIFGKLTTFVFAEPDRITDVAGEESKAAANAYRLFVGALDRRDVSASFFVAADDEPPDESSFLHLSVPRAASHFGALGDRDVMALDKVSLVGDLDELSANRGAFKLQRPTDLPPSQRAAWHESIGGRRSLEGQLGRQAAHDVTRFNAWSKRVEVELEIAHYRSVTTTHREELRCEMLRIVRVIDELPPAPLAAA